MNTKINSKKNNFDTFLPNIITSSRKYKYIMIKYNTF